jgi:plasmid stability protein
MTITLNFPPETERELRERATANGQTVEGFIRELVEREVVTTDGAHTVPLPQRSKPLDEILEPVRREFEESGMTDEGLVGFLTEVRDEVRKEKRLRKTP